ncbi:MAG TPA: hypothetical protein VIQ97_04995, partial [Prevotella sp.]
MKRLFRAVAYGALMALALTNIGCTNRAKSDFDKLLVRLAGHDQTIDRADWQQIETFLDANKVRLTEFYHDDTVDAEAVKAYIGNLFEHRRPSQQIAFVGVDGKETL